MLVIAGTISIDPEKREAAIGAAVEMMEETRKEEALDAHFKAPHMARFQGAMGGFGVRGMKVQRYEIASVAPMGR
jgi:quinol monooxygenase YgiN